MKSLILGSTSSYRAELLKKLGLPFQTQKPNFDEDSAKNEALSQKKTAVQIAELLSRGKAQSLAADPKNSKALIIAGDQLVSFRNEIIGKAHGYEKAFEQLKKMKAETHELVTAVTLQTTDQVCHLNHITKLKMKNLTDSEIKNYLEIDTPYDCAGSYKIEKSGIALFSEIECNDFTAIQGLPLIWLSQQLKEMGYELFKR